MSDPKPAPKRIWRAVKGDVLNPDRPWGVVQDLTPEECEEAGIDAGTVVIAEVTDASGCEEQDAHLLAAAPDMYEACKTLLKLYDEDGLFWPPSDDSGFAWRHEAQDMFDAVRAAIAKAEKGMP